MTKLDDKLKAAEKKKAGLEKRVDKLTPEYKARRKGAFKAHNEAIKLQEKADKLNTHNPKNVPKAKKWNDKADLLHVKAQKEHVRAQHKLGKIKEYQQRIHNLRENEATIKTNLAKWEKEHGVRVVRNQVSGGTERQQLRAALEAAEHNCKTGDQHNYYSMYGGWDVEHVIYGMPYGHRFDCSSFGTGIHKACGLPDPNGQEYTAGYTGTLMDHCEKISRSQVQVGDFVIYGSYPGHHVEVVLDPSREITIGHGSAPIDRGVFNLFGDGDYAFYRNPGLK